MRIIPNQFEKRFVSRFIKSGQKSIRLHPINFETSIRNNPNQSETKFSIHIKLISDWSKSNFQSESIQINPMSEYFGSILIENTVRIVINNFNTFLIFPLYSVKLQYLLYVLECLIFTCILTRIKIWWLKVPVFTVNQNH